MNITVNDFNSITQLFYSIVIIGLFFSFFLFSIIRNISLSLIKRINQPQRIKTEEGFLYRSSNGLYLTKQRLNDIEFQNKLKKRNFWIKRHQHQIERLKNG